MADSDSEKKRQEAAQIFAGMTEVELRELAEQAWSLTELGKQALGSELTRRGLEIGLAESAAGDAATSNLVTLRQFRDLPEALLAKGALESAGVQCFLADDMTIRMDWLWSNALGGIKLCVKSEDADAAAQLLDQGIPEVFDVKGIGEYKQPSCPNCKSLDISSEALNKPVAYTSILLGVPIPLSRHRWRCNSCSHLWHESDDAPQPSV
jgi:hypothetical protein